MLRDAGEIVEAQDGVGKEEDGVELAYDSQKFGGHEGDEKLFGPGHFTAIGLPQEPEALREPMEPESR
jgi:hypothetical protein